MLSGKTIFSYYFNIGCNILLYKSNGLGINCFRDLNNKHILKEILIIGLQSKIKIVIADNQSFVRKIF